jgi:HTH-type transcriptional regulator/antitoxin HigA
MKARNQHFDIKDIMQVISPWLTFSSFIKRPTTEEEYDKLVKILDHLLDLPEPWKNPQIEQLIHYLGYLIEEYDEQHYAPQLKANGVTVLKFLMEQHHLKQSDLPEIGSQSVVSEILHGKRQLNVNHIKALSKRFGVSPDVFIDD